MNYFLLTVILFFCTVSLVSQNVTAKIIDRNTKLPIPYATIKTGEFSGVISNEEGFFTIVDENSDTSLTISCMGYKTKTLPIQEVQKLNFIISLEESINELNTVYISNKKPNADSIIAKARQRLSENYGTKLYKHELFSRQTAYVDFKNLNFEVERASHIKKRNLESANKSLDSLAKAIINSKTIHFKDFKADLYVNDSAKSKMIVHKATELLDQEKSISFEDVQKKGQKVMLKYLDTTLTYKLKTGLFKIEDSLSLKEDTTKEVQKNEYEIDNLKSGINSILKRSQFGENDMLTKILDSDLYEYSFEDTSYFNNELIYVIRYKPKRSRSKYSGRLFIIDESYAIAKVDFEFAEGKRGEKLNLKLILGVKYIEDVRRGTIIYQKNTENKYQPQYIKYEEGRYFYVSRPLKFIENSPRKNKTSFDFTIEGNIITKEEVLLTSSSKISTELYDNLKQEKIVPYIKLNKYDPTIWGKDQTLEPLEEMKQFKTTVEEN
jgi:hypothetical protein